MLRSHPRISSPTGESQFMVPLHWDACRFGDLGRIDNVRRVLEEMRRLSTEFITTDLHGMEFDVHALAEASISRGADTIPKIIRLLFETNAVGEGKVRWLDKTPYYACHMPTIYSMFPDATFIHIIRDGRDCALSMLQRRHDLRIFNVYSAATTWKRFVDAAQASGRCMGNDRYLEVYYEKLVADPKGVMQRVCGFLAEQFDEGVVRFEKSRDPHNKTPLLSKPVDSGNTAKWRHQMSARAVGVFECVAGETLGRNEYPLVSGRHRLSMAEHTFYRLYSRAAAWYSRRFVRSRKRGEGSRRDA